MMYDCSRDGATVGDSSAYLLTLTARGMRSSFDSTALVDSEAYPSLLVAISLVVLARDLKKLPHKWYVKRVEVG